MGLRDFLRRRRADWNDKERRQERRQERRDKRAERKHLDHQHNYRPPPVPPTGSEEVAVTAEDYVYGEQVFHLALRQAVGVGKGWLRRSLLDAGHKPERVAPTGQDAGHPLAGLPVPASNRTTPTEHFGRGMFAPGAAPEQ